MAIKYEYKKDKGEPYGLIKISNGDLQALTDAMDQYGFVDQEALLRYALVALLNATDNKLYVKKGANILSVKIADNLIKKDFVAEENKTN
ncbi:MAG: hypothetical protein RIQ72_394 [Candidatus Parcubacteria bacterium]|jgi:hypothetical protein